MRISRILKLDTVHLSALFPEVHDEFFGLTGVEQQVANVYAMTYKSFEILLTCLHHGDYKYTQRSSFSE